MVENPEKSVEAEAESDDTKSKSIDTKVSSKQTEDKSPSLLLSGLQKGTDEIKDIHKTINELMRDEREEKINQLLKDDKTLETQFGSYIQVEGDYQPPKQSPKTYGILKMKQDIDLLKNFLGVLDDSESEQLLAVLPKNRRLMTTAPDIIVSKNSDLDKSAEVSRDDVSSGGSCEYGESKNSHILRNGFLDYFLPTGNVKTINLQSKK